MNAVLTWVFAVLAAILIIGLIGYARGPTHHRGNEVGSLSATTVIVGL
jgi:hypothetical protein